MDHVAPPNVSPSALTAFLHEQIPLARAMEIRVTEARGDELRIEAPLAPNKNHLGTAFGGSLHAVPTLACYAAVWLLLREAGLDGHVIVKRSEARYRAPVAGQLCAICRRPAASSVADFIAHLRRHRKARLELAAEVRQGSGNAAVEFTGTFVAVI